MGWLRSNGARVAWLAFFALACQFVFTFGHVHLGNVGVISTTLAISADAANGSTGAPASPTTPTGLTQDFCAVCKNISLANALVLPVSSAPIPLVSFVHDLQWSSAAIGFASRDHFYFSARGPPHS
jgi:hypothetical protein